MSFVNYMSYVNYMSNVSYMNHLKSIEIAWNYSKNC